MALSAATLSASFTPNCMPYPKPNPASPPDPPLCIQESRLSLYSLICTNDLLFPENPTVPTV